MLLQKKYNSILVLVFVLFGCAPKGEWLTEVQTTFPDGSTKTEHHYLVSTSDTLQVQFLEFHPNGSLKIKGEFDTNGNRHGLWEAFYPDSTKWSSGSYNHGMEDGKKTVWYENGQKRFEGSYKEGKETGAWKFWNEQGKLMQTVNRD